MNSLHRTAVIVALSLLLATSLVPGRAFRSDAVAGEDLPWPYCAPDVTQPPPDLVFPENPVDPNPDPSLGIDPRTWVATAADGIVIPSTINLVGNPDASGFQEAAVTIGKVVWEKTFLAEGERPFPVNLDNPILVMGEGGLWVQAIEAMNAGARVPLAFDFLEGGSVFRDSDYSLVYAMDANPANPQIISAAGAQDTAQFNAFLGWSGNPLKDSDPLNFVKSWNVEMEAPPAAYPAIGPVSLSFDRWQREVQGADFPTPGTAMWWAKAPPLCRSIFDAPSSVLAGVPKGEVWVEVPDGWRVLTDSVICLSTSVASMGCGDTSSTTPAWPYIHWDETFAFSGEPVKIQVALLKGDAVSWVDRVTIGEIPADYLTKRPASAETLGHIKVQMLVTGDHPSWDSYQEVSGYISSGGDPLVLSTLLSNEENVQLAEGIPPANTEFVCSDGDTSCP